MPNPEYRAVVIGASAGGRKALAAVLAPLPATYALPILVVQHLHASDGGALAQSLQRATCLRVVTARDKQRLEPGTVYVAPANYHMLCERTGHVGLSVDAKVHWSRPSIDVFFDSAVHAWGKRTLAVILTGANADGAEGMGAIRAAGGVTFAQAPETAECPVMPQAAIDHDGVDEVLTLARIAERLMEEGLRG